MNIQLFNFLEDNNEKIVELTRTRLLGERPAFEGLTESTLKSLLEHYLDGYIDMVVTGQLDSVERLFGLMSRVLLVRRDRLQGLFDLPLTMQSVIRGLLTEEYADPSADDAMARFNAFLDETESVAFRCACRFLDIFEEQLEKRVSEHDKYLERLQSELSVDLSGLRMGPATASPGPSR